MLLAGTLSPLLLDPLVVALSERVEDGQHEEDDHGQHELFENPAKQARFLKFNDQVVKNGLMFL